MSFFTLLLNLNFKPRTLLNLLISIPPSLNISGLDTKLIIVDSKPIFDLPPFKTNLIFFPNSSFTSSGLTALIFVEIFALGAASG